jgi:hypothetical protein
LRELFYGGVGYTYKGNADDKGVSLMQRRSSRTTVLKCSFYCLAFSLWALISGLPARAADLRPEDIVTVLPKDAIPAILSPSFDEGGKAPWLNGKDLVVGVEIAGDSRAYPVATLSRHEIVNDKVGGIPIAVTW